MALATKQTGTEPKKNHRVTKGDKITEQHRQTQQQAKITEQNRLTLADWTQDNRQD